MRDDGALRVGSDPVRVLSGGRRKTCSSEASAPPLRVKLVDIKAKSKTKIHIFHISDV